MCLISFYQDHNLMLNNDVGHGLTSLREFHLSAPLGADIVGYILKGADDLECLTLGIEWPDPAFCDNQPQMRYYQSILIIRWVVI